ncbi:unnamed protein product [Allacma fusca]|uniref:Ion transport domain-containing protein n=1 Tax=Allacma fusca TaxID=39272 RepID=A0A8J2JRA2_9HEXA|nr:unnamed protein product [Allacma fusca]
MLVFRVLCGEWIEPLIECFEATAKAEHEYKCFFIFLPVFIFGNLNILNLFLALLLNSFDTEQLESERERLWSIPQQMETTNGRVEDLTNPKSIYLGNLRKIRTLSLSQFGSTQKFTNTVEGICVETGTSKIQFHGEIYKNLDSIIGTLQFTDVEN